ncbi:AraC family transcriptional regulator [uncultured Shimia sp.]|uniref:helix-turn-helix domain-containing protein n=1 Tax=uncultured Shimia sp. TaxID=573152 RepID=UPI002639E6BA|nr:AraC family transcriptional regulator [uncultured Shimia sp.]
MTTDHTFNPGSKLPLVRASVAAPVIAALQTVNVEPAFVLDPLGLNEAQMMDPQSFLPHDVIYQVFQAVSEATNPNFCASVGQNTDLVQFIPLGDMLTEALTLGGFFTRFTQAVSRESNATTQSLLVEESHAYFSARRSFCPTVSPGQADAFLASIWISLLHRVLDFRWDPHEIILRVSDPDALPKQFHGVKPIKCSPQGYSIRFPSSWLSYSLTPQVLENAPDVLAQGRDLVAPIDFLAGLEGLIGNHLATPGFGVEKLAKLCGIHPDTLNSRLTKYDQTASQVITRLKREQAEKLLRQDGHSVNNVAAGLGYSDPTAFSRAFRKWTGMSPSAFRRSQKDPKS